MRAKAAETVPQGSARAAFHRLTRDVKIFYVTDLRARTEAGKIQNARYARVF